MKAICSRNKLFIAASALLMLTLSSSAFEIIPGYAGQRRQRLTLHRKTIADGIRSTNSRALEENQLLPNDAEEQSTGIASTSSTSPTMESSDMLTYDPTTSFTSFIPTYSPPTYDPTTSFTSIIPTYSPSTSSTSIRITSKNISQSAPTKVTSLKAPPSATKQQIRPTNVTSANSTLTKSSKSTAKSSKSVSDETCPSGCSYVCEPVTLGKSSKSKSSKVSSNDTALDFRTAYSNEEMSFIEGSSLSFHLEDSRLQVNATNSKSSKAKSSKSSITNCTYSSKSSTSKSSKSMSINATNLTDSSTSKSSKSKSSKSSEADCNCSCQCIDDDDDDDDDPSETPSPTIGTIAKPSLSPSTKVTPCTICPNGVTFPNQIIHGSASDGHPFPTLFTLTCAQANAFAATQIKSDRDCATFKLAETACCPSTSMPTQVGVCANSLLVNVDTSLIFLVSLTLISSRTLRKELAHRQLRAQLLLIAKTYLPARLLQRI